MKNIFRFCVVVLFLSLLLPLVGFAQFQAAKLDLWVERVSIKDTTILPTCNRERVTMIAGEGRFGLMTERDTLALTEFRKYSPLLVNELNKDIYTIFSLRHKEGFIVFVTPVKGNAPHAEYSMILSTTNICEKKN